MKRLVLALLISILALASLCIKMPTPTPEEEAPSPEVEAEEGYYTVGEVYRKTFYLVPTLSATSDKDYRDGSVRYIKLIYGVYTSTSEALKEEQIDLDEIEAGVKIPVEVEYEITEDTPKGKLVSLATLVILDGNYDLDAEKWKWDVNVVAKEGESFEVR